MSFEKSDKEPEKIDNYESPSLEEMEGVMTAEEEEAGEAKFEEYEKQKALDKLRDEKQDRGKV